MKTIFDLQTRVVTLLCTAALAGLTACEADPVMQESGKLPDKGSIEENHVMLSSSNSVENRVDVLLTEGGVMTKNFYLRQTQPAAAGYSLDAWCDASLLDDYDAGDEIERTLLPEANYEFPDGKTLDISAAAQRSELKRIKFSASGLAAGEYVLPLTVAAQDAPDADKTLYYNVSVRQPYTDADGYALHDGHDLFFVFYINTNDFQPLLAQDYIMRKKLARGTTVAWYDTVGNIINLRKRRIILVDHNEATQAVEGFDQAEILEIIDHHRIGSLETSGPVYFRNQPVGCTATIITQMYDENGVEIRPQIAGLLLAAILSDTLVFRSPTCTPIDVSAANRLAKIAGVEIDAFASEMFEAGEKLDGKTPEEVFLQDFKVFMCGDVRFGVAQGSYMTRKNLKAAQQLLTPYLPEACGKQNVEDLYMLLTDVPKEESVVICTGRHADEMLRSGFEKEPEEDGGWVLPGVVSRKKQFIPALMSAYQEL